MKLKLGDYAYALSDGRILRGKIKSITFNKETGDRKLLIQGMWFDEKQQVFDSIREAEKNKITIT